MFHQISLCIAIWLLMSAHVLTVSGNFTIVPETQYVYLNHNVTYECATNLSGCTPRFSNGGYDNETILPGGGIKITKTFNVTSAMNGTSLRCYIKENPSIYTPYAYAYAQGPPEAVSDLQGYQLDNCCIVFSWSPPFTLGQLSAWYQVTLSVGEEVMLSEVIYITNYTYCPIDLTNGEYRLNITTMNGAGTGIWNSNTTMFKTNKTLNVAYRNYMTYRRDNHWTYHFKIPSTQLCTQCIMNTTVMSCNLKNFADCYNSTNVTIITDSNGYKTIISVIDLPPREFNTFVYLQYKSRQIFQTTPVVTSSHDLQQLIITNTSNDILCLQFIFVNGSTTNEVHLYVKSNNKSYLIGNVSSNNQLIFTKCFSDIPPGNNWTLYVCDGVLPQGNKTCSNPAVILTDISITGNVSNSSSVRSSVIPTTSINVMSTSTPSTTTGPDKKIIGSVFGIVIFVIGVGIGTILSVCLVRKRCSNRNTGTTVPAQQSPDSIDSKTLVLVCQDKSEKIPFNKEDSADSYKTPIPVQDDKHKENPNDIPITVRDNNPQSPSSLLPLLVDVLSRSETPHPPSLQYDVIRTNFNSSTCFFERESKETGNISKPLPSLDTSLKLQLTFGCNSYGQILSGDSPPSNKDETPSLVPLYVDGKEVNNRAGALPNVQSSVTYSEVIFQSTNNKTNKSHSQKKLTLKVVHKSFLVDIGLGIEQNPDKNKPFTWYTSYEDKPFTWSTLRQSIEVGEKSLAKHLEG